MTSICKVDNVVSERLTSRLEFDNDDRNKLFFFFRKIRAIRVGWNFIYDRIQSLISIFVCMSKLNIQI